MPAATSWEKGGSGVLVVYNIADQRWTTTRHGLRIDCFLNNIEPRNTDFIKEAQQHLVRILQNGADILKTVKLTGGVITKEVKTSEGRHVCPVWVGYLLASPLRKIFQNPRKILAPYVTPGMRVMDIGSAMGFFSLPLAHMVGSEGHVICIDLQQKMLDALVRRARRAGVAGRIEPRLCGPDSLGVSDLGGRIDFALAFAVVHEVVDSACLFSDIHAVLKPESRVLVAEPRGCVSESSFAKSIATAETRGFDVVESPRISRSHAAILERNTGQCH